VTLARDFQRADLAAALAQRIGSYQGGTARFMEFCGSHTSAIMRYGIRQLLPESITLTSGPGCPVCVTDNADIDRAIALAYLPDVTVASFGDMLRVPGSAGSLQAARADGADVRVVYSPLDALKLAHDNPERAVIFLGVGFETTAPTVAASVLQAQQEGLANYHVLSLHKVCPPVVRVLLDSGEYDLQGLICPGHVSAVIGSRPWQFIADEYGIPCVVTGFEPVDILQGISMLAAQRERGEVKVEIAYRRGVNEAGNPEAVAVRERVFEPCPARWRGFGEVAASGLALRPEFAEHDAARNFKIEIPPPQERPGCLCGAVLRGVRTPPDCGLFRRECTPENPVGPCMVSFEGTCAAYYRYGETDGG